MKSTEFPIPILASCPQTQGRFSSFSHRAYEPPSNYGFMHTTPIPEISSLYSSIHYEQYQTGSIESSGSSSSDFNQDFIFGSPYKYDFDNSSQDNFQISVPHILTGQEFRTTLMIRNIPNKYNQLRLLNELNERHKNMFDFFYLPIDP